MRPNVIDTIKENTINTINYPKCFTTIGEGFHDTLNIGNLRPESNAKIYIFDRYVELLK